MRSMVAKSTKVFDGDGNITEDEFVRFWRIVKGAGHDETESWRSSLGPGASSGVAALWAVNIHEGGLWGGYLLLGRGGWSWIAR